MDGINEDSYKDFVDWFYNDSGLFKSYLGSEIINNIPKNNNKLFSHPAFLSYIIFSAEETFGGGDPYSGLDLLTYFNYVKNSIEARTIQAGKAKESTDQLTPEEAGKMLFDYLGQVDQADQGLMDVRSLPDWGFWQGQAALDYGESVGQDGKLIRYGDQYYLPKGTGENMMVYPVNDEETIRWFLGDDPEAAERVASEFALQREKFDWDKEQDLWYRDYQMNQLERQRQQDEQAYKIKMMELEQQKADRLTQMKANPRNWIQAWFMENPEAGKVTEYSNDNGALNKAMWGAKNAEMALRENPTDEGAERYYQASQDYKKVQSEFPSGRKTWTTRNPAAPTMPEWLKPLAQANQYGEIQPGNTTIASGQLWNKMNWSQREGTKGYVDYSSGKGNVASGEDYEDLIRRNMTKRYQSANFKPTGW